MGFVKFLNLEKGFGFIVSDQTRAEFGDDIFVHSSQAGGLSGERGQKVSFSVFVSQRTAAGERDPSRHSLNVRALRPLGNLLAPRMRSVTCTGATRVGSHGCAGMVRPQRG